MSSPDAPIGSAADDLLNRAPFVDEIFNLAASSPVAWNPRIGIYGSWGAGKTSILNMLGSRLHEAHHVVARFNPWGFRNGDEMFDSLADAILEALTSQGENIRKLLKKAQKASKGLEQGSRFAGTATQRVGDFGIPGADIAKGVFATAEFAGAALQRVFAKKKTANLMEALDRLPSPTRCVVLIDDIDRADPKVLPPLLFALHEVLNALPIIFVIALDPVVVGAALREHHPGFGDGLAFLEKLIQFPRWLPDVTDEDRARLSLADVERNLHVIDRDALRQELESFPRNPRELRTLLRSLWGLNHQSPRYRTGEIRWNLVIRLAVLRHRHRKALEILLEDEDLLTTMIALRFVNERGSGERRNPELEQKLSARGVDPACLPEFEEALARDLHWDGPAVVRHARLLERPPAITRLELETLFSPPGGVFPNVRHVLEHHVDVVHRPFDQVVDEALTHLLEIHNQSLALSSENVFEHATVNHVAAAARAVTLVRAVLEAQRKPPSVEHFRRVLLAFNRWAHFTTLEAYQAIHADEQALLIAMCQIADDPGAYLEVLSPWDRYTDRQEEAIEMRRPLEQLLERAVDLTLDRILERPDGVSSMLREHRSSERWRLLRRSAWTQDRILRLKALETDASAENALDLLRLLANPEERMGRSGIDSAELDRMASDREITKALWDVMTSRPLNFRFFASVEQVKAKLDARRGEPLAEPSWWVRLQGLRAQSLQSSGPCHDEVEEADE